MGRYDRLAMFGETAWKRRPSTGRRGAWRRDHIMLENKEEMVEPRGIEPLTSAMPLQRSPS